MSTIQVTTTPKNVKELTGRVFGRWTVLGFLYCREKTAQWLCKCECETTMVISRHSLMDGHSRSCGCLQKELTAKRNATHGQSKLREYRCWKAIIHRCSSDGKNFAWYKGRGITVCERWAKSFPAFFADMGEAPTKFHSIDRINNDGNYEPGNCRWATAKEQNRNKRNSKMVEIDGVRKCLAEWAELSKIRYGVVYDRIESGWNYKDAIFTPVIQ